MKHLYLTLATLTIALTGCHTEKQEATALFSHEEAKPKPIVAVVPVIDHTSHELPMDLSTNLTQLLRSSMGHNHRLLLRNESDMSLITRYMDEKCDPFSDDINWMKDHFSGSEFACFVELSKHDETPTNQFSQGAFSPSELQLHARLRVVDLRNRTPKVILQEVIQEKKFVPFEYTSHTMKEDSWEFANFSLSPIGMAHQKLVNEISKRAEEYILLHQLVN